MRLQLRVDLKKSRAFHGPLPGSDNRQEVTAMDVAPIPPALIPPPPPPPPPPLPPPPPPPALVSRRGSAQKQRLRNLNWERIPKERVEGRKSVWSGALTADEDDDFTIDLRSLDELFCQKEAQKNERSDSFGHNLRCCRSPQKTGTEKVSLLDPKRSMNVGIFLRQLKIAASEIVEDVRQGAGERYGAEKLAELCKLLPDAEEEARLKRFNRDHSLLREPDLFIILLIDVRNVRLRLDAMILQQEFDPAVTSLCVAARCLGEAARELLSCHKLHSILRLVLRAGNYMNAGGYAGNAAGFRIASLLKLADTKANKPGVDLLHFVAMEAVKKDEDLLTFPSQLSHVSSASRLSEETVLEDLSRLHSRVETLQISVQTDSEMEEQMRPFLEAAKVRLMEAEEEVESLRKTSQGLVEFFCEDESSFKLEEACHIFHCFSHRFQRAVRENAERELQEQRRAERQRENLEKRRSLAVCSGSELDDLERTLERNLSYTWSRRSLRRQSQRFPSFQEKISETCSLQSKALQQVLVSEDNSTNSLLRSHSLKECFNITSDLNRIKMDSMLKECVLQTDVDGNTAAMPLPVAREQGVDTSPITGLDSNKAMKVETLVNKAPERVKHVETDTAETNCIKASTHELPSDRVAIQSSAKISPGSYHLEISPQLAQEAGPISPEKERLYPRVGETLECHTLVKGLRSYEALSPTGQRTAPSHCSKWKKELEAEERDGANLLQSKEDSHASKTPNKSPSKRGLTSQSGSCNSSGIPKARPKPEPSSAEGPATPRGSRLTPTRSVSLRLSPVMRPSNIQVELKRSISTRDKTSAQSDTLGRQNCPVAEKPSPENKKTLPSQNNQQLVRGSPLRVSKRVAPQSGSQSPSQTRTIHSPTAATNKKAIRTAVINAAKAKSAKNADTVSSKTTPGTRSPGPKIPRPATQPMWR